MANWKDEAKDKMNEGKSKLNEGKDKIEHKVDDVKNRGKKRGSNDRRSEDESDNTLFDL